MSEQATARAPVQAPPITHDFPVVAATAQHFPVVAANCASPITICHFSTAHLELKSRTFHRQFLPLAAFGFNVRYVSPAGWTGPQNGINFIPLARGKNRLRRMIAYPSLLRHLRAQKADICHFQDPELLPLAFALKLIYGQRVIYDAYEDFPSVAASHRRIPRFLRPLASKFVAVAEWCAAHCFDGVMTADPFTMRRFAEGGRSRKLVFHNFPNLQFFPLPRPNRSATFDFVYRGGISERAGAYLLLDALRMFADQGRSANLLLLGYFDCAADHLALLNRIQSFGLESRVTVKGKLPHEEMANALATCRIGISPLQDTPKFRLNLPVKVFEYWACGMPVIASDLPPIRPYFRGVGAGLLFPAGDAVALSRAMAWMLDHPEQAALMGRRGRAAVDARLNNENEVRRLREFCQRIVAAD
jgi:glycosyltransferase involved in cell wall biosynthesis